MSEEFVITLASDPEKTRTETIVFPLESKGWFPFFHHLSKAYDEAFFSLSAEMDLDFDEVVNVVKEFVSIFKELHTSDVVFGPPFVFEFDSRCDILEILGMGFGVIPSYHVECRDITDENIWVKCEFCVADIVILPTNFTTSTFMFRRCFLSAIFGTATKLTIQHSRVPTSLTINAGEEVEVRHSWVPSLTILNPVKNLMVSQCPTLTSLTINVVHKLRLSYCNALTTLNIVSSVKILLVNECKELIVAHDSGDDCQFVISKPEGRNTVFLG